MSGNILKISEIRAKTAENRAKASENMAMIMARIMAMIMVNYPSNESLTAFLQTHLETN